MSLPKILSYPPRHPYVDRLDGAAGQMVHTTEPIPKLPHFYDVGWLEQNRDTWDITHFHFGWDQYSVEQLAAVLKTHRSLNKPIVVTVHDTRNPHTYHASDDERYLQLLLPQASAVVTLTTSAAATIAFTYGEVATVIPHGPILSERQMRTYREKKKSIIANKTIYVHVKGGRKNLDWQRLLIMSPDIQRITGYTLQFGITKGTPAHAFITSLSSEYLRYVELQEELTDSQLYERLIQADALFMPYSWGSHSGFIELANDLALPCFVYNTGHYNDQNPTYVVSYFTDDALQQSAVVDSFTKLTQGAAEHSFYTVEERLAQLEECKNSYADVYSQLSKVK